MICCKECFKDSEIRAAIEMVGHGGDCPICGTKNTWLYDSDFDADKTNVGELLDSILELYVPESQLPIAYPENETAMLEERLLKDWNIFSGTSDSIKKIVREYVSTSLELDSKIMEEKVGIPQLFDEAYLQQHSIMGMHSWSDFKKYMRNENRFHGQYMNLEILRGVLEETEISISKGTKFFRARVSSEKGYSRQQMWAPPDDVASPGRANSKGQSCLYLSSHKKTTVKEIRARAFDYVTIATFQLKRDIKVLDLSSIVHGSPFYANIDKVEYMLNEGILSQIQDDLAKPMSRLDSDLDYLPTQYISDFAKYLGYDGVKYLSTFDQASYNVALFDSSACNCTYHRTFLIGNLDYKMSAV